MAFRKFAACKIVEADKITLDNWRHKVIASSIKQDPKTVEASPAFDVDENGFIYVRVRAVSAGEYYGPNGNGDWFGENELKENYKTFIRRGNYMNHQSDDISKAVGIILDSKYWEDTGTNYVECLLAVDKSEPIADKIAKGIADSVSMGAIVDRCRCSICDAVATNENEYCTHLKTSMGKEYNGRKVYAINEGVNFYELSWVSVPADKDARLLERVASQTEKSDPKFLRMIKLADSFQALKGGSDKVELFTNEGTSPGLIINATDLVVEAAPEPPKKDEKPDKPKPKPPVPPKKEDKDLETVVHDVVEKEVNKGMESELINRVRDALKRLQLKQKVQREVSDEEILNAVRTKLNKSIQEPSIPLESMLHQAVKAQIDRMEEQEELDLGESYTVKVHGKVAGKSVAQLFKSGKAMGLYAVSCPEGEDQKSYYLDKFAIRTNEQPKSEAENSNNSEEFQVKSNLVIQYVPDVESLDRCAFVARKGNLEVRQVASKLLSEAVQSAILKNEKTAAGKVEKGVGEYDSTKGKVDVKVQEGKEKAQPGDNTKNLGGTDKGVGEYDATKGKVDVKIQEGKEPIQPSQVVQKYAAQIGGKVTKLAEDKESGVVTAEIEGGSLAKLAQLWNVRATLVKEAKLSNDPNISREEPAPVQTDMTNTKDMIARQTPDPVQGSGPSGSRGGEVVRYFGGLNKGNLSEQGDNAWARKVASLTKELAAEKTKGKLLEAALNKERNEKVAEKKAALVGEIMHRMAEAGALQPDMGEVLEWKEKGLEHDDAVAKATAMASDRQKRDLVAMDIAGLEQMKKTIQRFAVSNSRTTESDIPKPVDVPIVGTDTSNVYSLEDKLSTGW